LPCFGFIFQSGNPPSENQYFSTFQRSSHENENEAIGILGGFPKIFSSCIGPMGTLIKNRAIPLRSGKVGESFHFRKKWESP